MHIQVSPAPPPGQVECGMDTPLGTIVLTPYDTEITCGVLAAVAALLMFWLWRRRRRKPPVE